MEDMNNFQPTEQSNNTPQMSNNGNGLAIAALVCGILGIVGGFIPVVQYFTLVLAILGIVFGAKAKKTATDDKRGLAVAGLVCGIVGTAFGAIGVICAVCFVGIFSTAAGAAANAAAGLL
ncbi:MAG: DUF4190 domain-containing protein [Oscillospiraceae bacterium]